METYADNCIYILTRKLEKSLIKYKLEKSDIIYIDNYGYIKYLGNFKWFFLETGLTVTGLSDGIFDLIRNKIPHSNCYNLYNNDIFQKEAKKLNKY